MINWIYKWLCWTMTTLLSLISLPHAFEYIKNVNQFAIRSFNSIQFITQKLNFSLNKNSVEYVHWYRLLYDFSCSLFEIHNSTENSVWNIFVKNVFGIIKYKHIRHTISQSTTFGNTTTNTTTTTTPSSTLYVQAYRWNWKDGREREGE